MDIKSAKISNHARDFFNPENSMVEIKGQRGVICLANGINVPKAEGQSMPSKVTRILIESFMKRPSLGTEAMDAIFKLSNNGVLVTQSPQYPSFASASGVFVLKNKFVFATAGDNVIFHFVDGMIKTVFSGGEDSVSLGNTRFASPKVSEQMTFSRGTNTFLICSRKFAESFSEQTLEEALARATRTTQNGKAQVTEVDCDRWLKELWDMIKNLDDREEYSAVAASFPEKKKPKKGLIIGIIIGAVILIGVAAFFIMGTIRRSNAQPPEPPKQESMTEPLYAPGEWNATPPTGPRGETAPVPEAPPTKPAQN